MARQCLAFRVSSFADAGTWTGNHYWLSSAALPSSGVSDSWRCQKNLLWRSIRLADSGMREGILQEYYEEVMGRNPEVYFLWWKEDHWVPYDLSLGGYNAIKRRVMSRIEVLPQV
ncbi:hypothetical protein NL676_020413 [Syzygium grande]|nr:hypothetical protein NL676_020413 [Syzygium grande]